MQCVLDGGAYGLALVLVAASGLAAPPAGLAQPGPLGPQFQVNEWTTGSQFGPAVAGDGAGNFVVVWTSLEGAGTDASLSVQGRRYDAAGTPLGGEFQVNVWTTGYQADPAVASDAAGNFVVVWTSYGSAGSDAAWHSIQARRYDAAGTPLGGQFQVNVWTTDAQHSPAVAPDGAAGFVVVWSSQSGAGTDLDAGSIQGRRYDAAGVPLGGEFQVNTYTTSGQAAPAVAADATGSVVAWESFGSAMDGEGTSVQAQRYDAAGTPLGPQFQVNEWTTGFQRSPAVALDGAGTLVVAWARDYSDSLIQARRFDAAGTPLGPEFQVNVFTTFILTNPAVAADAAGNFLVVWDTFPYPGCCSFYTVQGQRYDAAGAPLGGEFQVNAHGDAGQGRPAVANTAGADFVVLWDSFDSAGSDADEKSIQGQILSPSVPTTTSSSVTSTTSSTLPPTALMPGRILVVRLHRVLRLVARPLANESFALPAVDPTIAGGSKLHIIDTMTVFRSNLYQLPASGWTGLGSPAGVRGWRYRGAGTQFDPCRTVLIKPRVIKALCTGAGVSLFGPFAGDVSVELRLGTTDRYCALFGGTIEHHDAYMLVRKDAPAPVSCP
jgi:hypothetical protein